MSFHRVALAAGILWFGMMAGFFYAYSATVSPGLLAASPDVALAAMQAINASVQNAFFAAGFWGAPIAALALLMAASAGRPPGWAWCATAALVYLAGAFGTTLLGSVPLNRALALIDPSGPAAASAILDYLRDWTALNHLRTAAATLAMLICIAQLSRRGG